MCIRQNYKIICKQNNCKHKIAAHYSITINCNNYGLTIGEGIIAQHPKTQF